MLSVDGPITNWAVFDRLRQRREENQFSNLSRSN